jgi:hypothetical protein
MCYILHEFCYFFRLEFMDGYQDIAVATWGGSEQTHRVDAPHGEGPRLGNCAQGLSWQVMVFGEELTSLAPLDKVFGVSHGRGPVETRLVCLADQVGESCVAPLTAES